jgi:hypothetical protein
VNVVAVTLIDRQHVVVVVPWVIATRRTKRPGFTPGMTQTEG